MDAIVDRILKTLDDDTLLEKLLALPRSDLNTLLLKLFQMQAAATTPKELLGSHKSSRFTSPSALDPAAYHLLESRLLSLAQEAGISGVLLSPAAPAASCSAFGYVAQNNVISALRGTELLPDPTNMLAIIIAEALTGKKIDNREPLHYCTTARVVRAQMLPDIPGFYSHFGIFCIVSSGKDRGSYACEKALLIKQVGYYKQLFLDKFQAKLSVSLRKRSGYPDNDGFWDRITEVIRAELPDVPLSLDFEDEGNGYYKGINFKLYVEKNGASIEVGDGGFVDWIQCMTGNKKERTLISGIGIDRLLLL